MGVYEKKRLRSLVLHVMVYGILFLLLLPFLWMVLSAFKDKAVVNSIPPQLIFVPTWENFAKVLSQAKIGQYTINSLIVALGSTILGLLLGTPAAYSIARYKQQRFAMFVLLARILPGISYLLPWFLAFTRLHIMGTYTALTLTHLTVTLPLIIWVMISFFEDLPVELEDAARIDGCTLAGYLVRVAVPLVRPGLAATAILSFIFSWNNFLFSLVVGSDSTRTLPVAVFNFISYAQIDWGGINAAATLITAPVILMVLMVQKNIVRGLAMGSIKG